MPKMDGYVEVNVRELTLQVKKRFCAVGVPDNEAQIIADSLVEADRRGVYTHGVICASRYIALIRKGIMPAAMQAETVADMGAITVWDAHRSNAQATGHFAMLEAIERAKRLGVGVVAVRGANHCGAGAYYSELAAKHGMIGVTMATGASTMAPWGGADRLIGNNPLAVAVPAKKHPDIVLDMAQSIVAFGKITNMRIAGEKTVPAGWALDREGNDTTDIEKVYSVKPMAGYKGYGTAVIIDILSGILFGGATGARAGDDRQGPSMMFIAFNIDAFGPREAFDEALDARIEELKGATLARGTKEIFMPGEIEDRNASDAKETLWIMPEILDELYAIPES